MGGAKSLVKQVTIPAVCGKCEATADLRALLIQQAVQEAVLQLGGVDPVRPVRVVIEYLLV